MKFRIRGIVIISLSVLYAVFFCIQQMNNNKNLQKSSDFSKKTLVKYDAQVIKIIDGDTVDVTFLKDKPNNCNTTERVRLIGINTPELNLHKSKGPEFYAEEAYQFTKQELNQQYVQIQLDDISNEKDTYGRLVAYIWFNDFLFNKILVERGYAKYYSNFDFNPQKMELLSRAEEYAKMNKLGMWNYE